jgi:hypothetical protein
MAGEVNISQVTDASVAMIGEIGKIGLWLQALGVVVLAWILFQLVALWFNRKRMKEIHLIKQDMVRIERKIDALLKKRR